MPSYVLKTSPDEDLYCIYSTVVDAITHIGDREEIRAYLLHQDGAGGKPDERLDRADKNGTSCLIDSGGNGAWYGWGEETIPIGEGPGGPGNLPRTDLAAYCRALLDDDEEAAARLVQSDAVTEQPIAKATTIPDDPAELNLTSAVGQFIDADGNPVGEPVEGHVEIARGPGGEQWVNFYTTKEQP